MAKEQKSENISSKSKKNEILEAYNELLEKVKTESSDPQELKTMQETKTIVSKAAGLTSDNINKKFVDLKLSMSNELSTLEQKIKKTEKETREAIETKYKYQIDLNNKEIEGERNLNQQVVASLKDKIKEQDTFIIELSQRANDSTKQVQSIALKALEGSSYRTANFENRKNNI